MVVEMIIVIITVERVIMEGYLRRVKVKRKLTRSWMRRERNWRIKSSLKKRECISMKMAVKLLRLWWLMAIKKIEMMEKVVVKRIAKMGMSNLKKMKMIIVIVNKNNSMKRRKQRVEKREKWRMRWINWRRRNKMEMYSSAVHQIGLCE